MIILYSVMLLELTSRFQLIHFINTYLKEQGYIYYDKCF